MDDRSETRDKSLERLQCRDEILQVLFWLAGEGFEKDMTPQGVARFVARPDEEVRQALEEAVGAGLAERVGEADTERYTLTAAGRLEGGRRFAEEFAGTFGFDTHAGACTDPNCDCHQSSEAVIPCAHQGRGGHHHEDRDRR